MINVVERAIRQILVLTCSCTKAHLTVTGGLGTQFKARRCAGTVCCAMKAVFVSPGRSASFVAVEALVDTELYVIPHVQRRWK
jgi:hypothetical protein